MEEYKNIQLDNNKQLQNAIDGIKEAVQDEKTAELFYNYLINEAPSKEEKEIIESIRDDEKKHNELFKQIYKEITGVEVPIGDQQTFEKPKSYIDGIKKALFSELDAIEKYRIIRKDLPNGPYKDILFDIITDEIKHSSKYNYIFALNSSNNNNTSNKSRNSEVNDLLKFTPDDLIRYIEPLSGRAVREHKEGVNSEYLYQEYIILGILIGLGKTPEEAIEQVEQWESSGEAKLLAISKMSRYFL